MVYLGKKSHPPTGKAVSSRRDIFILWHIHVNARSYILYILCSIVDINARNISVLSLITARCSCWIISDFSFMFRGKG